MDDASEKQRPFTRRDFLKVVLNVGASVPLSKAIRYLEGQPAKKGETIETEDAIYLPLYEAHTEGISLNEVKSVNPDVIFRERIDTSTKTLESSPFKLLTDKALTRSPDTGEDIEIRFFPDEILDYLSEKGASVAIEGISIPQGYGKVTELLDKAFVFSSTTLFAMEFIRRFKKRYLDNNNITIPDELRLAAASLFQLWSTSENISEAATYTAYTKIDPEKATKVKAITRKINAVVSYFHPQKPKVFLRNIMMARKLTLLGEFGSKNRSEKPRIAFQVGAAHAAINDLISLGEQGYEVTLAMLDVYPKVFLKFVVEHNGGIDAFCSTVVVPVKENLEGQEVKQVILDQRLKAYLEQRFKEPDETNQ